MYKNMSRAKRRHHRIRLQTNRRNYWGFGKQGWRGYCEYGTIEMSSHQAGSVINTPVPCSCSMCGNPRRNDWQSKKECLTMQERKALENYNNQIEELDVS